MADTDSVYSLFWDQLHINQLTGCIIWEGNLNRDREPVTGLMGTKNRIRDLVIAATTGKRERGTEVEMQCENDRCVKYEHFTIRQAEVEPEVAFTEEELERVSHFVADGRRQDYIATVMGTSRSRIAKMVRVLKDREAKSNSPRSEG